MAESGIEYLLLHSVVRGYHIYKTIWTTVIGEELTLARKAGNDHDKYAFAIMKADRIVGHVPCELSKTVSFFLKQTGTSVSCEITGKRKKGVGLEVPCLYKFKGPRRFLSKLKVLIKDIKSP